MLRKPEHISEDWQKQVQNTQKKEGNGKDWDLQYGLNYSSVDFFYHHQSAVYCHYVVGTKHTHTPPLFLSIEEKRSTLVDYGRHD